MPETQKPKNSKIRDGHVQNKKIAFYIDPPLDLMYSCTTFQASLSTPMSYKQRQVIADIIIILETKLIIRSSTSDR